MYSSVPTPFGHSQFVEFALDLYNIFSLLWEVRTSILTSCKVRSDPNYPGFVCNLADWMQSVSTCWSSECLLSLFVSLMSILPIHYVTMCGLYHKCATNHNGGGLLGSTVDGYEVQWSCVFWAAREHHSQVSNVLLEWNSESLCPLSFTFFWEPWVSSTNQTTAFLLDWQKIPPFRASPVMLCLVCCCKNIFHIQV